LNTLVVTSLLPEVFDVLQSREIKSDRNFVSSPLSNIVNTEERLHFRAGGADRSFFSFGVIYRNDGLSMTISQNILSGLYFDSFRKRIAPVFTKAVKNLLNIRDHLLLQLDLECGNISEEYFDKKESQYLTDVEKTPPDVLKQQVRVLLGFTNLVLDSEDISEILNCSVDDAEKVIKNYLDEV
jgi:hypothetical protein